MESESHEEAGDEEIESGAAGNESDMDLDLLAESDSDSEESQVQNFFNLKGNGILLREIGEGGGGG